MSIIIDPHAPFDKQKMFERTTKHCREFLKHNRIRAPKIISPPLELKRKLIKEDCQDESVPASIYGLYYPDDEVVYAFTSTTKVPVKTPGWSWSFPCSKSDLTVIGIVAHEVGHHIENVRITKPKDIWRMKSVMENSTGISGYDCSGKDPYEAIAESLRLFILNPHLLRVGRPKRWDYITRELKLKHTVNAPWRVILKHAHPRIISSIESWIHVGEQEL